MNDSFFDTTILTEKEENIKRITMRKLMFEPKDGYEYILRVKDKLRVEAYGYIVRILYKLNTRGVDKETLVKVFDNVPKNVFMTKNEYEIYEKMPDKVVIFRGTDNKEEDPKLSWTLDSSIGFNYYVLRMHSGIGKLFVAIADKYSEIFAFFDDVEKEVIAKVSLYTYLDYMD